MPIRINILLTLLICLFILHSSADWESACSGLNDQIDVVQNSVAKGDNDEAIQLIQQVIECYPLEPNPYLILGKALAAVNRDEEASYFVSEAVRIAPDNTTYLLSLADLNNRIGSYDEALKIFEKMPISYQNSPLILNAKAYTLYLSGSYDQARILATEAVRQNPDSRGALDTLGAVLVAEGKYAEGLIRFQQADAASYVDPEVAVHLGETYHALGRLADAQDEYQRAVRLDPYYGPAVRGYAKILIEMKRYDEASDMLCTGLSIYPGDRELTELEQEVDTILLERYLTREQKEGRTHS